MIYYFSSLSGNTHRFVERLGVDSVRIPVSPKSEYPEPTEPYILVCPTYADGLGNRSVPKQVKRFLSIHRRLMRGGIAAGNRNFGWTYAIAGKEISEKCGVPLLYSFEMAGDDRDVENVKSGIFRFMNG